MLSGQIRSAVIILIVTALNFSTEQAQVERACRTRAGGILTERLSAKKLELWRKIERLVFALILGIGVSYGAVGYSYGRDVQTNKSEAANLSETVSAKDGLKVSVAVESPSDTNTLLRALYFFEYREGKKNLGVNQELDRKPHGVILDLRKSGKFSARPLETLLIAPFPNPIRPHQLLSIGLGKREELPLELLESGGRVAMREALRLGVRRYAQTFGLRASGSPAFGAGEIAQSVIEGAISVYATEREPQARGLAGEQQTSRVTHLTTPEAYKETVRGVKRAINKAEPRVGQ